MCYVYLLACRYVWMDRLHWWAGWFCLPMSIIHFIPCRKTPVNYKVRGLTNKHPAIVLHNSATWQQVFFSFWDQDSNIGIVDSFPLNVCRRLRSHRPGGLRLCDSLYKQNSLETFVQGNNKTRRFTGPPTPSGLTAAAASLSRKETKRIKEWKQETEETFAMWASRIRGNSEWGRSSSSFPLQWGREGCLLQIDVEEAAHQEVWRIYHLPPRHSAPKEWSLGASVAAERPVPCLDPLCCLFFMHRRHKNVKQDWWFEAI